MRYLCVHCDKKFDVAEGEKPRCPTCRRLHGLEPEVAASSRPRWIPYASIGAALVVLGVGYAWWAAATPPQGPAPLRPLSLRQLREYARREGVVDSGDVAWLAPGESVRALAEKARGGSPRTRAEALLAAFTELRRAEAFVPFASMEPPPTPPRSVESLARAARPGARLAATALELAGLFTAAAREAGLRSMVAEVTRCPGLRAPLEPSGSIGHYAAAVSANGDFQSHLDLYDPHRGLARPDCESQALTDLEVAGAFLNLRGLERLVQEGEPDAATRDIEAALKLAPRSAAVRVNHATLVLFSGAVDQGLAEFRTAAGLRPDAPRHHALAGALFRVDPRDGEAAAREIHRALEEAPDYAAAHATLGMLHVARDEMADARSEMEIAERLDPTLPDLPIFWAQYFIATEQPAEAVGRLREVAHRRPRDPQAHLLLAKLYQSLNRFDDMCHEIAATLRVRPNDDRLAQVIEHVFTRARLEDAREGCGEEEGQGSGSAQAGGASPPAGLHLDDSKLLGGGSPGGRYGGRLGGGQLQLNPGGP